jgi:hypothetical protein
LTKEIIHKEKKRRGRIPAFVTFCSFVKKAELQIANSGNSKFHWRFVTCPDCLEFYDRILVPGAPPIPHLRSSS